MAVMLMTGLPLLSTLTAQAQAIVPPTLPDKLKAPSGEVPSIVVKAKGVQIYTCKTSTTNAAGFEWTLKAPEADLFNEQGVKVGKHYAGPSWEANDGSKVVGEIKERLDAPDGKAIPWLLLKAKSNEGNGTFSKITSVQRVDTAGGLAPAAADCAQSSQDKEVRVDYSANYYFYAPANRPLPASPASGSGGGVENSSSAPLLVVGLGLALLAGLAGLLTLIIFSRNKRQDLP